MIALRQARASVARHASDCGSTEVQGTHARALPRVPARALTPPVRAVAVLTKRIAYMTEHLQAHRKDKHSRLGLMGMLATRKKLLQYLRRTDGDRYLAVITGLGLKDKE